MFPSNFEVSTAFQFLARDSIMLSALLCYRPSVRPSVCLSDGWIIQKRLKLWLWNFHPTVAPSL